MVSLGELRRRAAAELLAHGCDSPKADTDVLLRRLLGFDKTDIILGARSVTDEQEAVFNAALARLKCGEPVQYVTGVCEFMSLDFRVSRDTLIPRADTEILVEAVIGMCRGIPAPNILDIGCGSGCIAVSLARYIRGSRIVGADISDGALDIAAQNAALNRVQDQIDFVKCDIMRDFPECPSNGGFDVIVSNPPYIPPRDIERLASKVRDFEPRRALDGGEDGLDFYRRIVSAARLKRGGILAFEVGIGQAEDVRALMQSRFENITIIKDLSGTDRVVTGFLQNRDTDRNGQNLK